MINRLPDSFRRFLSPRRRAGSTAAGPTAGAPIRAAVERARWVPRPAEWEMLADVEQELQAHPQANVMMLIGNSPSRLGPVLEDLFPDITVHRADLRVGAGRLHTDLATWGPYDMIIDDSRRVDLRTKVFRNCWYHLSAGGVYVVRDVRKKPWPAGRPPSDPVLTPVITELLQRRDRQPDDRDQDEWRRAESLGRVNFGTEHLILENRVTAYAKMRERQMNQVIDTRADGRAELIKQLPARGFTSRAQLDPPELLGDDGRFKINFAPPPMSVRRYRDALVLPHQVAIHQNLIVPDSFRHNQSGRLRNRGLYDLSRYFATVGPRRSAAAIEHLPGRYFQLDSEWREHFGHLLTEQLSRLWAWPELKRRLPDLKAVLSLRGRHDAPPPWELSIFAAAGIDPGDIVVIHGPTRVDELIAATPMLSSPHYIDPRIEDLWNSVGEALVRMPAGQEAAGPSGRCVRRAPGPIFVTRPPKSKTRPCHNQAEVEDYFRGRGYRVVRPELLTVGEQVCLFSEAPLVAGFAGSGMFSLMFRRDPVPIVLIRSSAYTSVNEYLISAIRGHTLTMIDSVPDVDHPPGKWSWDAFHSGFVFDFDREGRRLSDVLDSLGTA
ncbi:MAG: glycosyltransferase family 61 protein [Microlunatus sp.]|nr:glycosyltransferase family 61 protein [Microlunatus sp.]